MSSSTNASESGGRVGYDPVTDTYHNQHDWEVADSLCVTIIMTVSAATGQETTAMEPLYSILDPDALEALITDEPDDTVQISFSYEECTVTVGESGKVVVQPEG